MSSKPPWLKFYPADWRADPALRICSLAARGLWIEMLAIMHEASPRGHLLVQGKPVTDDQLAAAVGSTRREVSMRRGNEMVKGRLGPLRRSGKRRKRKPRGCSGAPCS